jgi:hypothetical protein
VASHDSKGSQRGFSEAAGRALGGAWQLLEELGGHFASRSSMLSVCVRWSRLRSGLGQ